MDQWRRKQMERRGGGGVVDLSKPPPPGPNAYVDVEGKPNELNRTMYNHIIVISIFLNDKKQ